MEYETIKTDVYSWNRVHSQECYSSQYSDPWYLDSMDNECDCEYQFCLVAEAYKCAIDEDQYITVPGNTIDAIGDRWSWLSDGHRTDIEALECAITDIVPGIVIGTHISSMCLNNVANGEWALSDIFTENCQ